MRHALQPHRESAAPDIKVEVEAGQAASALLLCYIVTGEVAGLLLPPPGAPERSDRLWQHTCFEIFIRTPRGEAYQEFNFAPSGQWAAYRFDGRRSGMRNADVPAPEIQTSRRGERFELRAKLDVTDLPNMPWLVGLSAVIEEANGRKSYWALAHPPGDPDFHHKDCFALELAAAGQP